MADEQTAQKEFYYHGLSGTGHFSGTIYDILKIIRKETSEAKQKSLEDAAYALQNYEELVELYEDIAEFAENIQEGNQETDIAIEQSTSITGELRAEIADVNAQLEQEIEEARKELERLVASSRVNPEQIGDQAVRITELNRLKESYADFSYYTVTQAEIKETELREAQDNLNDKFLKLNERIGQEGATDANLEELEKLWKEQEKIDVKREDLLNNVETIKIAIRNIGVVGDTPIGERQAVLNMAIIMSRAGLGYTDIEGGYTPGETREENSTANAGIESTSVSSVLNYVAHIYNAAVTAEEVVVDPTDKNPVETVEEQPTDIRTFFGSESDPDIKDIIKENGLLAEVMEDPLSTGALAKLGITKT